MRPCATRHPVPLAEPFPACRLCWLWEHRADYRELWDGNPAEAVPAPDPWKGGRVHAPATVAPPALRDCLHLGPGAEMQKLLTELGLTDTLGCGCEAKARQMDAWGVAGTRARRAEVSAWLADAAQKAGWWAKAKAAGAALASGVALRLDPADVYGSLVDVACDRAAAKEG